MNVRTIEGECVLTRFRGSAPLLVNTTLENSLINGVSDASGCPGGGGQGVVHVACAL